MTKITWTNCVEQMPPDDENFKLIYKGFKDPITEGNTGSDFNLLGREYCIKFGLEWTPYTEEKWEALTK